MIRVQESNPVQWFCHLHFKSWQVNRTPGRWLCFHSRNPLAAWLSQNLNIYFRIQPFFLQKEKDLILWNSPIEIFLNAYSISLSAVLKTEAPEKLWKYAFVKFYPWIYRMTRLSLWYTYFHRVFGFWFLCLSFLAINGGNAEEEGEDFRCIN